MMGTSSARTNPVVGCKRINANAAKSLLPGMAARDGMLNTHKKMPFTGEVNGIAAEAGRCGKQALFLTHFLQLFIA